MKRKPSHLSESLHRQLNSYALAAGGAGVSLFACAQPSVAKIVYTPAHVIIGYHGLQDYGLDLNHDGIIDFRIHYQDVATDFSFVNTLAAEDFRAGNKIEGSTSQGLANAYALRKGAHIGSKQHFLSWPWGGMVYARPYLGLGRWVGARNRYLGLSFLIGQDVHYGWARLTVDLHRKTAEITAKLTGYAYETIPNKPIIAGKTHGKDVITVQPASLGHLARGATGLSAWRRKVAATH